MGGLNPSIPLQGQTPQIQGPLDIARAGLNVQQLVNAVQLQKQQQARNALATQQQQLRLEQERQQQQDMQTVRELAPEFSSAAGFDFDGLIQSAQERGVNPLLLNQMRQQQYQMVEAASKAGNAKLETEQANNKAAYDVLQSVKTVSDPALRQKAYQSGLNRLKLLGMDTSSLPITVPADKDLDAYAVQLGMHGQLLADAKTLAQTNQANAEAAAKQWQKFPELGVMVNTTTGQQIQLIGAQSTMSPAMIESKYLGIEQKQQLGQPVTAEERAFTKSVEKYKTLVPQLNFALQSAGTTGPAESVARRFGMTPEAFDQAAERYATTQQLPPVGRGGPSLALNKAIQNRAAELHPGEDLAANAASYKADAASLANITKLFNNVTAFENTAGKNLDVFLEQAKKVVDTGIPVLNLPSRFVAGRLGSGQQAAFETARITALTEIAKVLSSANAGSGVLSDSARQEVERLAQGDATLNQIVQATNILKRDMKNRHDSYAEQIKEIKKGMSRGGGAPAESAAPANDFFSKFGGKQRQQ